MFLVGLLILLTVLNPLAWLATLWRYYQHHKTQSKIPNLLTLGNISFGGTGKTPMAIWLSQRLRLNAIISKSYKASAQQPQRVTGQSSVASEMGDEALLLATKLDPLPIFSGPHKTTTLQFAQAQLPAVKDWWLIDDGYQHFAGRSQKQIILWDMTDIWSFGMWPWGRGREPIWSIRHADALVLTKCQWVSQGQMQALSLVLKFFFKKPNAIFKSRYLEVWPVIDPGVAVIGVAGLAKNELFFKGLRDHYQKQVVACLGFADHCNYQATELERIHAYLQKWPEALILTTAKDLIKLQTTPLQPRLRLVDIEVNVERSDELIKILST